MAQLDAAILNVLGAARLDGARLHLEGQLDRKLYQQVAKTIEAAGGKWSRKEGAHVFDGDAADVIEPILLTGEVTSRKQEFGQFDTPPALAARLVAIADVRPGMKVLEPNAGAGNIVAAIIDALETGANVWAYEIDPKRHAACRERHFRAFGSGGLGLRDFLTVPPEPVFDRVIMNPPFARQADIDHVLHAAKFLRPSGRLAAITSASVAFRTNRKTEDFRAFVAARGGTIEALPTGSFRESGTDVSAAIVAFGGP
jgi:predicted RNA methylase